MVKRFIGTLLVAGGIVAGAAVPVAIAAAPAPVAAAHPYVYMHG